MTIESAMVVELKPVPRTAEEWCARLCADDVTATDRSAFEAWLQCAPENRAEYELCALVMGVSRALPGAGVRAPVAAEIVPHARRRFQWAMVAGVAAIGLLAGLLAWWRALPASYVTHVGEQEVVALADGSTVELNTASMMTVDLEKNERHVTLRRGEAFFSVAPDPRRPFIVNAGSGIVRVVGTKFSVRVDGDNTSVTVVEGHVKLTQSLPARSAFPTTDLLPGDTARMMPRQPLVKLAPQEAMRMTSWREKKIDFENDPLSQVIEEVNRYSEDQFVIVDPKVGDLALSGVFRTGDTESVLFALRETYGLKAHRDGKQIYLER